MEWTDGPSHATRDKKNSQSVRQAGWLPGRLEGRKEEGGPAAENGIPAFPARPARFRLAGLKSDSIHQPGRVPGPTKGPSGRRWADINIRESRFSSFVSFRAMIMSMDDIELAHLRSYHDISGR